jgi:peptide methionine sulfoxide reductase msrA/msrB
MPLEKQVKTAVFAGGCFWCMEKVFEGLPGVIKAVSGYTGGHVKGPTYREVCTGKTGHYEAVRVEYDPRKIAYERLLETFWENIDPTDPWGQFYDRGSQYRTAIFYQDGSQKSLAEESKRRIRAARIFKDEIATKIFPTETFYPAEAYHQNYYKTCPLRFKTYHRGSGRETYKESVWKAHPHFRLFPEKRRYWLGYKKPSPNVLKKRLTALQFSVTQKNATEPPFKNAYWDNHQAGIYVDVVSGEPLFSSRDKFDSGTGWPSFTKPFEGENIIEKPDDSYGMQQIEVRSRHADSHLGHLFHDRPPSKGMRYCINSTALYFIPKEGLASEGYGAYKDHCN